MASISYIIATYSGRDHTNNGALSEFVLQIQVQQFLYLLDNKRRSGISNNIFEVIIVCPRVQKDNRLNNYYLPERWTKHLKEYDVELHMIDYYGDNTHHSYDQWIQGWNVSSGDYCILCEDDYYLDPTNLNIDSHLVELYNTAFTDHIGYLATFCDTKYHGFHAAISNGFVSRKTISKLGDALKLFYSIKVSLYPQVNFSHLFISQDIPISDYSSSYKILFWNSYECTIEDYSVEDEDTHDHIFIPVQYLLKQCIRYE